MGFHAEITFIAIGRLAFPGGIDPADELPVFVHEDMNLYPNCDFDLFFDQVSSRLRRVRVWSPRGVSAAA